MKTALITGAGGWLGLELSKKLLEENYYIKALDRVESEGLRKLKQQFPNNVKLLIYDLEQINRWKEELEGIDYLYHLAAKVHSKPKNIQDIDSFYFINYECTKALFNEALNYSVGKVIFISTVAVYGKENSKTITVSSNRNSKSPYGISKNKAEKYGLKLFNEEKFPIVIIQPTTVYGGNDKGNFAKLYELSKKGLSVVFGTGENKKTIIYYKDLIEMMQNIAEDEVNIGKTFICGTEIITYNEILDHFNKKNKVFKIQVPKFIAKILIFIGQNGNRKMINLAENIQTLIEDNIYEIESTLNYIDREQVTKFKNWKCERDYE